MHIIEGHLKKNSNHQGGLQNYKKDFALISNYNKIQSKNIKPIYASLLEY